MSRVSFKQLVILLLIFFLLFGDFIMLKKKLNGYLKKVNNFMFTKSKNRKKRI